MPGTPGQKFTTHKIGGSHERPVAVLAHTKLDAVLGGIIQLDGRKSYDPEKQPLTWNWSFVQVPLNSQVEAGGFKSIQPKGTAVSFIPDKTGFYVVQLIVNDGELDSAPVTSTINVQLSRVPCGEGIIPDAHFLWSYISNFWNLVEDREKITAIWSSMIQLLGAEFIKLWGADYNKSLSTIQNTYQRRWVRYATSSNLLDYHDQRIIVGKTTSGVGGSTGNIGETPGTDNTSVFYLPRGEVGGSVPISATYSWDSSNIVQTSDTSEVLIGDWIRLDSDGQFFRISEIELNVSVTIENPKFKNVPSGSTQSSKLSLDQTDFTALAGNYGAKGRVISINEEVYTIERVSNNDLSIASGSDLDTTVSTNTVEATDFVTNGVAVGDKLSITSGVDAGDYYVVEVTSDTELQVVYSDGSDPSFIGGTSFTYTIVRPMSLVVVDTQTIPDGQVNVPWRIPHLLHIPGFDFEEEGVRKGDIVVFEVTRKDLGLSAELRAQVIGVDRERLGFEISLDTVDPGDPALDHSLFRQLVSDLKIANPRSTDFQIAALAEVFISFMPIGINLSQRPFSIFRVAFKAKKIIHNSVVAVDEDLVSVPALQEDLYDPPVVLRENADYIVDGGKIIFISGLFTLTDPAPEALWAECSFFDNSDSIENNFGRLVKLSQDDLTQKQTRAPYLSAVKGLVFAYTNGPAVANIRLGLQILLGLPFSEERGVILEINEDFATDTSGSLLGRILLEDLNEDNVKTGLRRLYFYPMAVGIEDNPVTGEPYKVGDIVEQFVPLSKGVEVTDYIKDPRWWIRALAGLEILKYFTFKVTVDSEVFDSNDVVFAMDFVNSIKPTYTRVIAAALLDLSDDIEVSDAVGGEVALKFYDNHWGLEATNRLDDDNQQGVTLWRLGSSPLFTRSLKLLRDVETYVDGGVIKASSVTGWATEIIRSRYPSGTPPYGELPIEGDLLYIHRGQLGAGLMNPGVYEIADVIDSNTLELLRSAPLTDPIDHGTDLPDMTLDPKLDADTFETASNLICSIMRRGSNPVLKGSDLVTNVSDNVAVSTSADFLINGVGVGDHLIIESGANKGEYVIDEVSGAGASYITATQVALKNIDGTVPSFVVVGPPQYFRVIRPKVQKKAIFGIKSYWNTTTTKLTLQARDTSGDPRDVFTPGMVGLVVEVANSDNPANDGHFVIVEYVDSGHVVTDSASGVSDTTAQATIYLGGN